MMAVTETVSVPARFNGPDSSGNGGYACGILAGHLDGTAAVSLRSPIPLDTPLELARDGERLLARDGETLVAEAEPAAPLERTVPVLVGVEEARRAAAAYRGLDEGLFSHCFVCGLAREDSMRVFAGEVAGRGVVATPWTPPEWSADSDGNARQEFVWSALDCPTYFATYLGEDLALSFLARQSVVIHAPVPVGAEHVVLAWPIEVDGRKRQAGAAVLDAGGAVLASCRAMLVEPRG